MLKWKITDRVKEQMDQFMKVGGLQGGQCSVVLAVSLWPTERLCALRTYTVPAAILLLF